jgi:hypothetical protein
MSTENNTRELVEVVVNNGTTYIYLRVFGEVIPLPYYVDLNEAERKAENLRAAIRRHVEAENQVLRNRVAYANELAEAWKWVAKTGGK